MLYGGRTLLSPSNSGTVFITGHSQLSSKEDVVWPKYKNTQSPPKSPDLPISKSPGFYARIIFITL